MTSYLADTDVIIDHLGGRADVDRLVSVEPQAFSCPLSPSPNSTKASTGTRIRNTIAAGWMPLLDVTVLNVDAETARTFGKLRAFQV